MITIREDVGKVVCDEMLQNIILQDDIGEYVLDMLEEEITRGKEGKLVHITCRDKSGRRCVCCRLPSEVKYI